jgi:CspA family cold shock protein
MSIPGKILIALLIAGATAFIATKAYPALPLLPLAAACAASAVLAVLLSHKPLSTPSALRDDTARAPSRKAPQQSAARGKSAAAKKPKSAKKPAASRASGPRERGTVKWFNGSKGFGFIVRENGEEIFVHYRSILGEGRRGLRDGQDVEFRVETTDKGPQAEDVEGLD